MQSVHQQTGWFQLPLLLLRHRAVVGSWSGTRQCPPVLVRDALLAGSDPRTDQAILEDGGPPSFVLLWVQGAARWDP